MYFISIGNRRRQRVREIRTARRGGATAGRGSRWRSISLQGRAVVLDSGHLALRVALAAGFSWVVVVAGSS